jgi:dienelactone hydrolase
MRLRAAVTALLLLTVCASCARDVRSALTASDSGSVWFRGAGGSVALSGDLRFPAGQGPFPAVVLMHGCAGLGNAEGGWAVALHGYGYATFVVDSFAGRGLQEVCTNARTLLSTRRIPDAYGALRILATHPKVAPNRIALMGFSHGAIAALTSATVWAKETYSPRGGPAFRAFLAFYPYCNAVIPEMSRISAPLRIHTGELDDWTPARTCQDLVRAFKEAGFDAEITVYPNAHHSFDNIGRPIMFLADVENASRCTPRLASVLGPILNDDELTACFRKGATIGWNRQATEEARRNVRDQLANLMR